ncbi:MAG: AgmX/PglI C-terminal domain-containing protein [Myxococcales bacterium]|nr:AgmX/PglI C-terminal domain-containing protein [Myxococcales bacterium]
MQTFAADSRRHDGSGARSAVLLAAVVLVGACGGPAANEPAAEPAEPGPAAAESATEGDAAEPAPPAAEPSAETTAAGAGAAEATPPETQQAARTTAPPEPELQVEPPAPAAPPPPPGNGRLVIGRPEIARGSGRINGNLFARAVERKRGGLLTCYNVPLGADPALRGTLVVVLVVDPQGMVGVRVEEDDDALAAAGVTSCVVQKLRQVSFSETPPGSELWVRVPLEFKP